MALRLEDGFDADSFLLDVFVLEFRGRLTDPASVVLAVEGDFVAGESKDQGDRRCWLPLRNGDAGVSKSVGDELVVT